MAIMAPSGGPLKTVGLQGKRPQGPGSVPFGGSNGHVCLFFCSSQEVLPQRGHGLRPYPAAAGLGSNSAMMGPLERSAEMAASQGKSGRVRGPRPLGAGMDSSAFFRAAKSAATTGAFAATFGSETIIVRLHPILVAANRMVKP